MDALHDARVALPFSANVTTVDPRRPALLLEHATQSWLCADLVKHVGDARWCVLKGFGLEALYPSGYHRQSADLDLAADADAAASLARRLLAHGLWMQATAAAGLGPGGVLMRSETWRGVIAPCGGPVRVRVDIHVDGIATSRATWLSLPVAFWEQTRRAATEHGFHVPVPSPWWQREFFLLECFERVTLRPRDVVDWSILDCGAQPEAPRSIARRAMVLALRAAVARSEGRAGRVFGLAWALLRRPLIGQLLEACAGGPRRVAWHLLLHASRWSESLASHLARRYPPEAGRRALAQHGAAMLLRVGELAPTDWSTVDLVGGRYAIVPSELVRADAAVFLAGEPT
jgi:hypothetical protein